jgi:hypothetical protein
LQIATKGENIFLGSLALQVRKGKSFHFDLFRIGTAVITLNTALLWTDGRYYLQADTQLDSKYWSLMKMGPSDISLQDWLAKVSLQLPQSL